jgi:hypothetical protein
MNSVILHFSETTVRRPSGKIAPGYSVIIMDNQVSLETAGYPSLSQTADALTDYPLPLPRWIICQTAQFGAFLLILGLSVMDNGLDDTFWWVPTLSKLH